MNRRYSLLTSIAIVCLTLVLQLGLLMTKVLPSLPASAYCTWVVTSCGAGCADNKDLYNCANATVQAVVVDNRGTDSNQKAAAVAPKEVTQAIQPSTAPKTTTTVVPTSSNTKPEGWSTPSSGTNCGSKIFVGGCVNGCMPATKTGQQWVADICGISVAEQQKLASQQAAATAKANNTLNAREITEANRSKVCVEGSADGCVGQAPGYQFFIGNTIFTCAGNGGQKCGRTIFKENASTAEKVDVMGKQVDVRDTDATAKFYQSSQPAYNAKMESNCANGRGQVVTCNGNKLCIDFEADQKAECDKVTKRMDTYTQQGKNPYNWVEELSKTLTPSGAVSNTVQTVNQPGTGNDYDCRLDHAKAAGEFNYMCASGTCREISGGKGQCVNADPAVKQFVESQRRWKMADKCTECVVAELDTNRCQYTESTCSNKPDSKTQQYYKLVNKQCVACSVSDVRGNDVKQCSYIDSKCGLGDAKSASVTMSWHLTADGKCEQNCNSSKENCISEVECKKRLDSCLTTRSQQKDPSGSFSSKGCNPDGTAYLTYNGNGGQVKAKYINPGETCTAQVGVNACLCGKSQIEFGNKCPSKTCYESDGTVCLEKLKSINDTSCLQKNDCLKMLSKSGSVDCSGMIAAMSKSEAECVDQACNGLETNRKSEGWQYCAQDSTGGSCKYCRTKSGTSSKSLAQKLNADGSCVACNSSSETCVSSTACAQLQKDCATAKSLFPKGTEAKCNPDGKASSAPYLPWGPTIVELAPAQDKPETCPKEKRDNNNINYVVSYCRCNGQRIEVGATCTTKPTTSATNQAGCRTMLTDTGHYACWTVACDNREQSDKKWTRCTTENSQGGQCTYCTAIDVASSSKPGAINCANLITKSQQSPATAECKDEKCQNQENNGEGWQYCKEETGKAGNCKYCREKAEEKAAISSKQVSCAGMINNSGEFLCQTIKCNNLENGTGGWTYCLEGSSGGNCQYCQRRAIDLKSPVAICKPGDFRCGKEVGSNDWFRYQVCQTNGTWSTTTGTVENTKCPATLSYEAGKINKCKEGDRSACGEAGGCKPGQQMLCEGGQLSGCVRSDACAAQVQQVTENQSCANLKQLSFGESSHGRFVGCSGKKNCFCDSSNKVVCYEDADHNSCAAAGSDTPVKATVDVQVTGKTADKPTSSPSISDVINKAVDAVKNAWDSLVGRVTNQQKKNQEKVVQDIQTARNKVMTTVKENNITLQADGGICATGGDCQSGFCMSQESGKKCVKFTDLRKDGSSCNNSNQCQSGRCNATQGICLSTDYKTPAIIPGQLCPAEALYGCACFLSEGQVVAPSPGTVCYESEWNGCSVDSQCKTGLVCRDVYQADKSGSAYHMRKCIGADNTFAQCGVNQTFCPSCLVDHLGMTADKACVNQGESCDKCMPSSSK